MILRVFSLRFSSITRPLIVSVLLVILGKSLAAAELEAVPMNSVTQEEEVSSGVGSSPLSIYGGFGGGFGSASGQSYQGSITGGQFLLGGLVSYQIPYWVFDAGAHWFYSQMSGSTSQSSSIDIKTRTGLAELSPRYRITDRWQVGPVLNVVFGTDTSFAPSVGTASDNLFLGIKGVYEFSNLRFPVRLWGQVSESLTLANQQVFLALAGIQIGIPLGFSTRRSESFEGSDRSERSESNQLKIILDSQKIFFSSNSDQIKPAVRAILKNIGEYLQNHPNHWDYLEISGHADQRGRYGYNLKLSEKRAKAVREVLLEKTAISNKVSHKVEVKGFSYSKPLDSANNRVAWAKNRRVELTFEGVKDPAVLKDMLLSLSEETTLQ